MRQRARAIPRRLELRHLPLTIHRRRWAQVITLILAVTLCVLPFVMVTTTLETKAKPITLLIDLALSSVFLLAAVIGLDRSLGYRLILDRDSFSTKGLLFTRSFHWDEVTEILARSNYRLPGYYASWTVDGSRHPRRHWSSLWFGFYEVPPLMQIGGKELTRLLRHAKRRADAGWPAPAPRTRQKAG